jgi:hypothetical protein
MELSVLLNQGPGQSYADSFSSINMVQIIRSLARTHAECGDEREALAWAKQVGSGNRIITHDDSLEASASERRIYALVGVAEGILDRAQLPRLASVHTTTLESAPVIDDVPAGDWTYHALDQLQAHKILVGYPKGYFSGKSLLTRDEFTVAIKRCLDAFAFVPPKDAVRFGPSGNSSVILAEDLKLLRKLSLTFKPQLISMGVDWTTDDDCLQKLQDKRLHSDISEALAVVTPKATATTAIFEYIQRPNWVYDTIQSLSPKRLGPLLRNGQVLPRYVVAVFTKRCSDAFCSVEAKPRSTGSHVTADSIYQLNDIVEIHKLVRGLSLDLPQLGMDVKSAEVKLAEAEEKRIKGEEVIDTEPPAAK